MIISHFYFPLDKNYDWLFPIEVCKPIGYINAFTPKSFLPFQLFHADVRFWVFALRASGLELNSSMMLDGRKHIQSVKSANFAFRSLSPCLTHSRWENKYRKKRTKQEHKLLPLSIARVFVIEPYQKI